jgi:hypothetical protein
MPTDEVEAAQSRKKQNTAKMSLNPRAVSFEPSAQK